MNKLLHLMQGTLLDEETEIVFTGKVHKRVYEVLETRYRMMGFGDRQKYLSVILERLADVKKPYKIMAVLLLLNRMSKVSERVLLSAVNALVPAEDDKETVAEVNMMNYYYSFIGSTAAYYGCDLEAHDQFDLSSKLVKYCEDAVDKVISLLKVQFVVAYCLSHVKKHQQAIRLVSQDIIEQIRSDLRIVVQFIDSNLKLVLQKHPASLQINYIYEKTLFIMKNMPKLRKLARLALLSTAFPIYQLEIKTNREIELTFANENVEERRGYQRKREVRSMQHIQDDTNEDEIDEDDILLIADEE